MEYVRPSSILYENKDKALIILDIPRTIEESQVPPLQKPLRRILSAQPALEPFETPEPKKQHVVSGTQLKSPASQISDLMTAAALRNSLGELISSHIGPFWHLPRIIPAEDDEPQVSAAPAYIPENAEYLHGSIQHLSQRFQDTAPEFNLIVLDPPWPNRSVRRKSRSYNTVYNLDDMRELLLQIPVSSKLTPNGLVAIWITNKPSILDFLTSPSGLFAAWGVELVAEWTWVKITASGEPIYHLDSAWRKPWEKLLIAKRIGAPSPAGLGPRVIAAVPDLHSRKPNLRGLFQLVIGPEYKALEVFARNLTAGWWSWGDDVLRFQQAHHWAQED